MFEGLFFAIFLFTIEMEHMFKILSYLINFALIVLLFSFYSFKSYGEEESATILQELES